MSIVETLQKAITDNFGDVKSFVLFSVALYGSVLSTFNFINAVQKGKKTIKIKTCTAMCTYENGGLGKPILHIKAINVGQREVKIDEIAVNISKNKRLVVLDKGDIHPLRDTQLPCKLNDGDAASYYISYETILDVIKRIGKDISIYPTATDSAGRMYHGRKIRFNKDELISILKQ